MTGRVILIVILLLAALLRFWNLGAVAPSASLDEASIGFNAYSILKTGRDEYGELPILSHRAYDDYRRATYLYLVAPFIALFGLNVVSVRLPAVILSILTVWATYFLTRELMRIGKIRMNANAIALLSSFLLAISPWHVYISRLGHESNAYLSFFIFGVLFFLRGEKNKNWVLILLSMLFFTVSLVSYYAGQVFIPLFVIGLFFIFRKNLLSMISSKKKILIPFFLFLILLIPIFKEIFSPEALVRFQGTSIFKPEVHRERFNQRMELWGNAVERSDLVGTILYSRYLFLFQVFMEGYISHFRPEWLFANSFAEPHKVPNMGLLYLWEIPLIVIGVVALLFSHVFDMKAKLLIFLWLILAPLPAAIATQAPHVMRSYNFLPTWQIFAAFGLAYIYYKFHKLRKLNILILSAFGLFILSSLTNFYKNYFIVFPRDQSDSFHYAFSKVVPYVFSQQENYNKIVFSNSDNLYQSYMVFLFNSRYDPSLYQMFGGTKSGGFAESHEFDIYEFRPINLKEEMMEDNVLYVVNPQEAPYGSTAFKTFNNLNGEETIKIFRK